MLAGMLILRGLMLSELDRYVREVIQPRFNETLSATKTLLRTEGVYLQTMIGQPVRNMKLAVITGAATFFCALIAILLVSAAAIAALIHYASLESAWQILLAVGGVFLLCGAAGVFLIVRSIRRARQAVKSIYSHYKNQRPIQQEEGKWNKNDATLH